MGREPRAGDNFLGHFPLDQVISGGVARDGIPALTDPKFVSPASVEASYILEDHLVMGVVINGEAKAYPHNIGWHHEIVNDIVGGESVVVSFCPLTGTGLVFDGTTSEDGRITTGVSGLLFNNNLIMYDRRDGQTLYPQMTFTGVQGPRSGEALKLLPVVETTWRYWKQLYPNTRVVSGNAGVYSIGDYTINPYGDYQSISSLPLFSTYPRLDLNPVGDYYEPKEMTLGVRFGEFAKAYPFPAIGDEAVINDTVDGNSILVVWYKREQLAIPYLRNLEEQTLTFEKVASSNATYPFLLKDKATGTTWNLKGEAIDGALKGKRLKQVPAHNAFWFAWASFWQNTGIYQ